MDRRRDYKKTRGLRHQYTLLDKLIFLAVLLIFLAGALLWRSGVADGPRAGSDAAAARQAGASQPVKLGIENLAQHLAVFQGKRVGLITNATGIDSQWNRSIDLLRAKVQLVALFAPEHGLRGTVVAGAAVPQETDAASGLPIFSLHGDTKKPTAAMLKNVDVLAFDIQDIGARPYTYIYTMAYAMQSAKEQGKEFVVFDRPNPLGGLLVEGGVLKPAYSSFIGLYAIPLRHGMTVGELARMFNESFGIGAKLTVIPMSGWKRSMQLEDTGLPWVMTSPNIPTPDSARVYGGTGLFGGTNVSEGIGTTRPFELVGAPWLDGQKLAARMNAAQLPGVVFRPVNFTPQWGKYQGRVCNGVQIHVTDKQRFEAVSTGVMLLQAVRELGGAAFKFNPPAGKDRWMIDLYAGGPELRGDPQTLAAMLEAWRREAVAFRKKSEPFLLY